MTNAEVMAYLQTQKPEDDFDIKVVVDDPEDIGCSFIMDNVDFVLPGGKS